jgi:hypothetical protein
MIIISQPISQDQQSIDILLDTSMVDTSHEESIIEEDNSRAKNIQLDLIVDRNEAQPNSEIVLVTQSMMVGITIDRQANEGVQLDPTCMLVKYGALRFIHEGGIDPTRTCDVKDDFILALDYYWEGIGVEYSSKHEDSMEVR